MVKPVNYILGLAKATSAQILAALNGLGGNFGFDFDQKRLFITPDDGANPQYLATLSDIAGITVADASETAKGVVEVADATEFAAGTDTGATGAPLVPKVSDVKSLLDQKIIIGGDLENTITEPHVKSSTTAAALFLIKDIAATLGAGLKVIATALQFRTADDSALTNIEAQNATFQGDVVVTGNLTVQGTNTVINTTETTAKDRIFTLNAGEVGAGVTAGTSGIEVDRGSEVKAQLLFNETEDKWQAGVEGALRFLAAGYSEVLPLPTLLQYVIQHNLNTLNVIARNYVVANGVEEDALFDVIDANAVRVSYLVPPATDRRIVVLGF
jgi:hypothetical protein